MGLKPLRMWDENVSEEETKMENGVEDIQDGLRGSYAEKNSKEKGNGEGGRAIKPEKASIDLSK